jgi:putative tricarboxylic transport membrane protein
VLNHILIVFSLGNLGALCIGVIVGLIIGALPGLGAYVGIALLIPLTFVMDPTPSILLLCGLYAAGIYGGSIVAVLLRVPGTSASAATAIDGYELSVRGKPRAAVGMATFSSVTGGVFSGIILLTLAPLLAKIATMFGPPEYFLMAIFGLTAIGSISTGNILKGLISGFAGLFFSTVGIDLHSGFFRFSFGYYALEAGLGLVPAMIGLFAFSQALVLSEDPEKGVIPGGIEKVSWNIWPRFGEIREVGLVTFVRSYIIGTVVGLLPGAGANIAQWISYGEAKRSEKGDLDSDGSLLRGVASAESANNATTGSSLVPLFVFGIPGSESAAILLGALMIHGLVPGMRMFTKQADIVYPIFWGFILANILMAVFASFLSRVMINVVRVPKAILIPCILSLCVIGAYTITNSIFQVWVMTGFGILGYLMRKTNFVPAAMLLGIILGPIAEDGFRSSLTMADTFLLFYFIKRPLSLTILAMIAAVIVFVIRREIKRGRAEKAKTRNAFNMQ